MEFKDAMKEIFKDNGYSQSAMAEALGYKHQSGMSQQLRNNNMSIKVLLKILKILRYEIRIVPIGNKNEGTSRKTVIIDSAGKKN